MHNKFNNVVNSKVDTDPYPHIVVDDIFDKDLLKDIGSHWPETSRFMDEVPGVKFLVLNRQDLGLLIPDDRSFWQNFMIGIHNQLVRSIFTRFSPALIERFPDLNIVETVQFRLMETDEFYTGMDPHTHYSRAPNWLFTILIYIDDEGRSSRGTTICWPKGPTVPAMAGYDHKYPDGSDMVQKLDYDIIKTIEFVPNRLFAIMDSPISFHSVTNAKSNKPGQRRRMIRAHVAAPAEVSQYLYGVSLEKFVEIYLLGEKSSDGVEWRQRDIEWICKERDFHISERLAKYVSGIEFMHQANAHREDPTNAAKVSRMADNFEFLR